jgi:hypothetical protein
MVFVLRFFDKARPAGALSLRRRRSADLPRMCDHPMAALPSRRPSALFCKRPRLFRQLPETLAERLLSALPALTARPSGSFVDIRELTDPDEYARLFGSR